MISAFFSWAISFLVIARFQLKYGYPTLMLIKAGGNDSAPYLGPTDFESLVEFVNDETGRPEKVIIQRV